MVRFSPDTTGIYKIKIKIQDSDGITYSEMDSINVFPGTDKGFIQVDKLNKQYYRHKTGEPYYPVGIDVAWAGDDIADKMTSYNYQISKLSENKANWMRYWLVPFASQALEWENGSNNGIYHGIGIYSQEAAATLDSILNLCNQHNIYMQPTLFYHGEISETVDAVWPDNPYNVANGGYLTKASEFFTNPNAKKQIKKLLRYIIARWAYSKNIFDWEFFNEVNFAGNYPSENTYTGITNWHKEMSQYVDSIDPYHHIKTTSCSGADPLLLLMDKTTSLDQLQFHTYDDNLINTFEGTADKFTRLMTKPFMNGEFGFSALTMTEDLLRKMYWVGIMKQTPDEYWYYDVVQANNWYGTFNTIGNYLKNIDFTGDGQIAPQEVFVSQNSLKLKSLALKSNKNLYCFIYDSLNNKGITGATLAIKNMPYGYYKITCTIPETGDSSIVNNFAIIRDSNNIFLPVFSKELALKIQYDGNYSLPVAIAGNDSTIILGNGINLNAGKSVNPSGKKLQYDWYIVSKPAGSSFAIDDSSLCEMQITPDVWGTYVFGLIVNDSVNTSVPDYLKIKVYELPVANAGNDTTGKVGDLIALNGSKSFDPAGNQITYLWTFVSVPNHSEINIMQKTTSTPYLYPDIPGVFKIKLVVNNGISNSLPDTVTLTISLKSNIITNNIAVSGLNIYPNPVTSVVNIENNIAGIYKLDILDITGRKLQSIPLNASSFQEIENQPELQWFWISGRDLFHEILCENRCFGEKNYFRTKDRLTFLIHIRNK